MKMEEFHLQITHQRSLEKLYLCVAYLQQIPDAIKNPRNFKIMVLGFGVLKMMPPFLEQPDELKGIESFFDEIEMFA
jgi:hypothetical protein